MAERIPVQSTEEQVQQLAQLQHQCDQMMFWINYKASGALVIVVVANACLIILGFAIQEVVVWPEELGTIGNESESALKEKYAKFHAEVAAQEVRVNDVLQLAEQMLDNSHPEERLIMRRREVKATFCQLSITS